MMGGIAEGARGADGQISVETALTDYGVVVSAKGFVDAAATAKTRAGRPQ